MSSPAAEKFMQPADHKAEAMPWLKNAPQESALPWMRALRATGAEAFAATGLPTPKWEGWQYTSLRALAPDRFSYTAAPVVFVLRDLPPALLPSAHRIVVVNGQLQTKLSDIPAGIEMLSLAEAAAKKMEGLEEYLVTVGNLAGEPFNALNAAYVRDGFILKAPDGFETARPVEILFYTLSGAASYPRVLYHLGKNSRLTLIEHHAGGAGAYFANTHMEVVAERDSCLKLYRFCEEGAEGSHISQTVLSLHKSAVFEGFSGAFGGALTRQEFRMQLLDRAISASISGIYALKGRQSHDFTVLADHFEEGGKSVQHFRGVIDDQARAVFQGKIHVRRSAQKTDGYQSHHALLLSAEAEAGVKPELEIYADDVRCSHGTTSGHLDEQALFYLRSRGIPEKEARALLIESFLHEVVSAVSDADVQALYSRRLATWLGERGQA